MTPDEMAEDLGELSRSLSAKASDFAKRMGMADELGEKLGENPELPIYILRSLPGKAGPQGPIAVSIGTSFGRLMTSISTALGA